MGYGEQSSDAVYESSNDYFTDSSQQEQQVEQKTQEQAAPQIDYAQKYNEVQQQLTALQPKLEVLNRLETAINPAQQIDPQQKAVNDFIAAQAAQALNPQIEQVQKQYEEMVLTQVDDWAASKGFMDGQEALDWLMVVQHPIRAKAQQGDAQASQLLQNIVHLNNNRNWLGLQRYVEKNWNSINQFAGGYARKAPVQAQIIGQSYGNNTFTQQGFSTQDYERRLNEAEQKGDWNTVRQLQEQARNLIRGQA